MTRTKTRANANMPNNFVSVLDYGAVGDGVTDDRAAIQEAIDSLINTGGTVYFPQGRFLIGSTPSLDSIDNGLNIPITGPDGFYGSKYGIRLMGHGRGSTSLLAGNDNMCVVRVSRSNVTIENLLIDGGLDASSTQYSDYPPGAVNKSGTIGVLVGVMSLTDDTIKITTSSFTLENACIQWCALGVHSQTGPRGSANYHASYRNIEFTDNTVGLRYFYPADFNTGAGTLNLATSQLVDKCRFNYGNCGIYADGVAGLTITNSYFERISYGTSPRPTATALYIPEKNPNLNYGHIVTVVNTEIEQYQDGEDGSGPPIPIDNSDWSTTLINVGTNRNTSLGVEYCNTIGGNVITPTDTRWVGYYTSGLPGFNYPVTGSEVAGDDSFVNHHFAGDVFFQGGGANTPFTQSNAKVNFSIGSNGTLIVNAAVAIPADHAFISAS